MLAWLSIWSEVQVILHMVQLMPLPPHHLLLQQNPEWFILLVLAYPGFLEKRPLNGCVCVCCHKCGSKKTSNLDGWVWLLLLMWLGSFTSDGRWTANGGCEAVWKERRRRLVSTGGRLRRRTRSVQVPLRNWPSLSQCQWRHCIFCCTFKFQTDDIMDWDFFNENTGKIILNQCRMYSVCNKNYAINVFMLYYIHSPLINICVIVCWILCSSSEFAKFYLLAVRN